MKENAKKEKEIYMGFPHGTVVKGGPRDVCMHTHTHTHQHRQPNHFGVLLKLPHFKSTKINFKINFNKKFKKLKK